MAIAADLLQSLVPISQFNKGQVAKIFDRLHSERECLQQSYYHQMNIPD